jgi:hypothetical protein
VHPVAADLQFDERQYVRRRDIKSAVSPGVAAVAGATEAGHVLLSFTGPANQAARRCAPQM